MRKTKIICTLGPATDDPKILRELFLNGMNVARLNFSHGGHSENKKRADALKKMREELKLPVALMIDTRGPEVRIKDFKDSKISLEKGNIFTLTTKDIEGTKEIVSVTHKNLPADISIGNKILIDDGLIELSVLEKNGTDIKCLVNNGGNISNRKGINIPNVKISLPYINKMDEEDIKFAIENDFDLIAASFVSSDQDIKDLKAVIEKYNGTSKLKIISKIENMEGVLHFPEIIRISDGIMVARGDMGVEIPIEELPGLQKKIIKSSYFAGKPVITATQMLDSMIRNPRPTRAETTDVANSIYDGTSAIMLSGETSIGNYPVLSVQTMSKIALQTENDIHYIKRFNNAKPLSGSNITNAICYATCSTAHTLGAKAIISVTKSGRTPKMVSKFRPQTPIIAATTSKKSYYQLSLSWNVFPILTETKDTTDEVFMQAIDKTYEANIIKDGDLVILTGGIPIGISGTTNNLRVHIVGGVVAKGIGISNAIIKGNTFCVTSNNSQSLNDFHTGDIIVIKKTTDDILPILKNASGIITEESSKNSQAVTVAQALGIPLIYNAKNATEKIKSGTLITINCEKGTVISGN